MGSDRIKRLRNGFVALACAVPMITAASGGAEASPPADPAAADVVATKGISHANELGSRMAGYLSDHPWAGYSTSYVDQTGDTLYVYGKGTPPAGLVTELAAHRGDSTIRYAAATYTNDEMIAEAGAVLTRMTRAGVTPRSVRPDNTGNGLVVEMAEGTPGPGTARTTLEAGAKSRMPIAVEVGPNRTPVPISRDSDTARFYGGALIMRTNPNGSRYSCSSGVTVFYGSAPNRRYGMLTAAHCGESFFYTRAGLFVGRTHKINAKADVQILRTGSGQPYSNRIFNGDWNTTDYLVVRGGGNPPRGLRLCVSGGRSGTVCGLEVTTIDVISSNGKGPGFWFRAGGDNHGCAVQGGDSGSPMYMPPFSDGSVTIAGIAVAGDLPPGTCPRHPIYPNDANSMYGRGFATRISSVLSAFSPPVGLATRESGAEGGTG